MESSSALKKAFLSICYLCSTPLSLRPDFQRVLLTNSLKNWIFAFLKLKFLILLFACVIPLRSLKSTIAWQPPSLMSLVSSHQFALVSNTSSIASPCWTLLSFSWLKKLYSIHSPSLLNCLQLTTLLFQKMSEWLKSPRRMRACKPNTCS